MSEVTHDLNNYTDVIYPSPAIDLEGSFLAGGGKFSSTAPRRSHRSTGSRRRSRRIGVER